MDGEPLADEARRCRAGLDELGSHPQGHRLDQPTQWAVYGGLYTDAQRLCDEICWARDQLNETADMLRGHPNAARQ